MVLAKFLLFKNFTVYLIWARALFGSRFLRIFLTSCTEKFTWLGL